MARFASKQPSCTVVDDVGNLSPASDPTSVKSAPTTGARRANRRPVHPSRGRDGNNRRRSRRGRRYRRASGNTSSTGFGSSLFRPGTRVNVDIRVVGTIRTDEVGNVDFDLDTESVCRTLFLFLS